MSDLEIPDFLKRTETEEQAEARRAKQKPRDMTGGLKVHIHEPPPPAIAKAIARDLGSDKRPPARPAKLPRAVALAVAENETRNQTMETAMSSKSKSKKSAPKKAKATPKAKAPKADAPAIRPGSKVEMVANLLKRKEGCTTADVLKATGWPTVSMPNQAKQAGLVLKKEKNKGEPTRYYAS